MSTTIDEAVRAVGRLGDLSRHACRRAFEQRFDAVRMARDYVEVYQRLAQGQCEEFQPRLAPFSVTRRQEQYSLPAGARACASRARSRLPQ